MNGGWLIGVQMDLAWEDREANWARAARWLGDPAVEAGSLVVLPEMFTSGFSMNPARVAEAPGGVIERRLAGLARERGIHLVAGMARESGAGRYANEAVVIGPEGTIQAVYRKQRPFRLGEEDRHYLAGDRPVVFGWGGVRVAPFICYDLRFPELFRAAARERPEVFVVIASWPDKRVAHWRTLLQARAIENQAYVLGVNRVGEDPAHRYTGRSMVVSPWGEILADGGEGEGLVRVAPDWEGLRDYRRKLPFLEDYLCCDRP